MRLGQIRSNSIFIPARLTDRGQSRTDIDCLISGSILACVRCSSFESVLWNTELVRGLQGETPHGGTEPKPSPSVRVPKGVSDEDEGIHPSQYCAVQPGRKRVVRRAD